MPEQTTPPLLRDFIVIPESPSASDLVLKLADGVANAEETLREYVIPPRLVDNFDQALRLVQNALGTGASRAAYLHGSFGSGKSHFMAALHALLLGTHAARSRDEFAPLLDRHDPWLDGRKFLLVPYHLMGAKSLEQRVLGGYIEHVRKLHPDAPIPAVHRTDALLDQSQRLRSQIGDEAFIAGLPDRRRGRMGRRRHLDQRPAGCRVRRRTRRRGPPTARHRPAQHLATGLLPQRPGRRRGLRLARPRPHRNRRARQEPRVRRPGALPRRADPLARQQHR